MANEFYTKGKERILRGEINFESGVIKAALVKNTYAQDIANDLSIDTVGAAAFTTQPTLTAKTIINGVFDAADVVFPSVPAGEVYEGVVLFLDAVNPANAHLIAYIDNIIGFPVTSTGADIGVQWDNGANKIFSL